MDQSSGLPDHLKVPSPGAAPEGRQSTLTFDAHPRSLEDNRYVYAVLSRRARGVSTAEEVHRALANGEEPRDIAWRFAPEAAAAAREYLFHQTQRQEMQRDGSLIVRFRAGGLLEMCWHLYTWGSAVTVLEPPELKRMMAGAARHRNFVIEP